jgi:hypothetical protein
MILPPPEPRCPVQLAPGTFWRRSLQQLEVGSHQPESFEQMTDQAAEEQAMSDRGPRPLFSANASQVHEPVPDESRHPASFTSTLRRYLDRRYALKLLDGGGLMEGLDAAARAAGVEVTARCALTHGADAVLLVPGEEEPVRWPAAVIAAETGLETRDLPGRRFCFTVRETATEGRSLAGFREVPKPQ